MLPFKICNHLFLCLKGNRMVAKYKLCSRIFIKDIDHARKIENYFKVTNKGIESTSISMLMNETNAKSVALNLFYLIDDFSLAGKFGKLFVEIANNSFELYILFLQIYFRVFLNALSDITNLVTKNNLLEHEIKKDIENVKWRIFGMLLSYYCQTGAKLLAFWNLILKVNAFEHMFHTYRSGIDYNAENFKILNLK